MGTKYNKKILLIFFIIVCLTVLLACDLFKKDVTVVKTNYVFGTLISLEAFGSDAANAIDEALDRVRDIEKKMDVHTKSSEISKINERAGKESFFVSDDTFFVIKKGIYHSEKSKGKFDITVGPIVNLWGIGTDRARIPSTDEINQVLSLVDYKQVELNEENNCVILKKPGMLMDLGGIAKGYAADEAIRVFKEHGIKSGIVDLGGNIYVLGKKPVGNPWKIGLQDPFKSRGNIFATVEVNDKTLVTSGPYERYMDKNGERYHHIMDTGTGFPVENKLAGVTIIADCSIDADALSTAVFAMGLKDGWDFINALSDIDAVFVTVDHEVYVSSGVKKYNFNIVNKDFREKYR